MKILHCIYDHTGNPWVAGGGAVRACELNRRLADRHDVTVVCGKYPGAKDYRENGLQFRFVGTPRNNYLLSTFSYAYHAACFIRASKTDFDVIIEDFAAYNPLFSFLHNKNAVLQVHQKEGLHILRKYLLLGVPFYFLERFYPRFFRNSLTVSEISKKKFSLPDDSPVIQNGFDDIYLSVPEKPEDEYVLFLGRLEIDSKGLDILLDAWRNLTGIPLKIAGRGKDEKKMKEKINGFGISDSASLLGFVQGQEKIDYISRSKFMVIPSRFEGQPIVILEAAALGKAVVVSDIPELSCAKEEGFGISFRTEDATDLAEKITKLWHDKSLRKEMGQQGREFAKVFSWDRITERYEKFLLTVYNK